MKKWIILFLLFPIFFIVLPAKAGSFPNDAKDFHFDSINNQSCTSTTAILIPAVDHDRTLLYFTINNLSNKLDAGADIHLYNYGDIFPNQFVDTEKVSSMQSYLWHLQPANIAVTCQKGTTAQDNLEHIFFRIIYTDYNLASSTDAVEYGALGSSTITTMIDKIGYTATTTLVSAGVEITQAVYSLPVLLLKFVIALITICAIVIFLFLITKKNNKYGT